MLNPHRLRRLRQPRHRRCRRRHRLPPPQPQAARTERTACRIYAIFICCVPYCPHFDCRPIHPDSPGKNAMNRVRINVAVVPTAVADLRVKALAEHARARAGIAGIGRSVVVPPKPCRSHTNHPVASSFAASDCATEEEWRAQVTHSDVRLQWDPDHDPTGRPIERRAIQLGLRGRTLERFGREVLLSVEDITPFVAEQREKATGDFQGLIVPAEASYIPGDSSAG